MTHVGELNCGNLRWVHDKSLRTLNAAVPPPRRTAPLRVNTPSGTAPGVGVSGGRRNCQSRAQPVQKRGMLCTREMHPSARRHPHGKRYTVVQGSQPTLVQLPHDARGHQHLSHPVVTLCLQHGAGAQALE